MEIKGNNTKNEAAMKYQNIYLHLYDGKARLVIELRRL